MEKITTFKIYYLLFLTGVYFLLHSIRNLFQYLKKDNVLTRIGNHKFGIKVTNFFLSPFGLKYDVSQEIYYFFLELLISIFLLGLFIYFAPANIRRFGGMKQARIKAEPKRKPLASVLGEALFSGVVKKLKHIA